MAIDPKRVQAAFLEVVQAVPAERSAILDQACAGDAELRRRVEQLVRAHEYSGDLPTAGAAGEGTGDHDPNSVQGTSRADLQPGSVFAERYKLREKLGEGGMGIVWVADQSAPVQRRVALKVIKSSDASRHLLARFEQERQALAVMDHPNIAKVLDAGVSDDGQPYFVMELIKGIPLTKYCDEAKLTPKERLELFVPVCQAVQHAHQKGIIHRDLKPSNILVGLYDGRPVPKVIDFGVAKATGPQLSEQSIYTEVGRLIGTLEYMSPEQAELNNLDIDTRSDIYALGVILYELLTGGVPFSRRELKAAGFAEMLRIIKEVEPPKPSTRLSGSGTLPNVAAVRNTQPGKLTRLVRGELDWIVMKCLEKDRNRRYETANGLTWDIQRYLAEEPVLAAPPSAAYRLRKFARKHRAALATAAGITVLLVAGVAISTWQAIRATNAEAAARIAARDAVHAQRAESERAEGERLAKLDAQAQKAKAERAADLEKAANVQAQKRLTQIEKANEILGSIFKNLDPKEIARNERPLQTILIDNLDKAIAQLEGESIGDPLVVAAMQETFGSSLLDLGEPGKAIVLLEKARATREARLGPEHPLTLQSMNDLAEAYQAAGKLDLALPLYEETFKLTKAKLGPEHPDTLACMNNLAEAYQAAGKLDLALSLCEEALKLTKARLGPEHPLTLQSMNDLAAAYRHVGKLELALPLYEETLKFTKAKLGPEHPDTLTTMHNLAEAYQAAGKLDLALPLCEETLKFTKAKLGPEHPDTFACRNNLAGAYQAAGKLDLALPLYEETLKLTKAKLGPEHPLTLQSMNDLAEAYQAARKLDLALPLCEETLKLTKAKLGPEHPNTLTCMNNLAGAYQAAGKLELALPLYEETLKLMKAKLGPEHPDTLACMNNLAATYQAAGKLDLALPLCEETLKLMKAKLGPEHPDTLTSMNNLAAVYHDTGKLNLALPLFEETLKLTKAKLGPEHPDTLACMNNLTEAYQAAGKLELALPLYEETLKLTKAKLGSEHPDTLTSMNNLAAAYDDAKQFDKAEAIYWEELPLVKQKSGAASPPYASALTSFGSNLLHQKKWTEAEPLLRECLAVREKTQPDEWTTFNNKSMLGGALLGQKKYAEAEPLLLAGYEGMKQHEAKIPTKRKVCLTEALERLVQLNEVQEKQDLAAKWRKELEARKEAPAQFKLDNPRPEPSPGTQEK